VWPAGYIQVTAMEQTPEPTAPEAKLAESKVQSLNNAGGADASLEIYDRVCGKPRSLWGRFVS
jgi:hypothetical protein